MSTVQEGMIAPHVPEPAIIRGAIISLTSILAIVFGVQINITWLDWVLNIYAMLAPFIAGFLIRQKVTPVETAEHRTQIAVDRALLASREGEPGSFSKPIPPVEADEQEPPSETGY